MKVIKLFLEWMERAEEEKSLHHALTAKGLITNPISNKKEWKPILIVSYDKTNQTFTAIQQNSRNSKRWEPQNKVEISRINFCLDAEDPRKFVKRVEKAYRVLFFIK